MKTGAERYQRFIARKRFKLWFFALLPLVLTTASIALFTSSRFDVMCGAVVMYLFFVGLITHGTATDPFHELRGEKRDGTKRHAIDFVLERLTERGLMPPNCEVYLDPLHQTSFAVRTRGFFTLKQAVICGSPYERNAWRHHTTEAILMHEVGHFSPLWKDAVVSKVAHVMYEARYGMPCAHVAMTLPYSLSAHSFPPMHVLCANALLLILLIFAKRLYKYSCHASEYLADSHVVRTLGADGVEGLATYLLTFEQTTQETHPLPTDRVNALRMAIAT